MAIVRKDKILSGVAGNLEHVKVVNGSDAPIEVTNGVFVILGDLMAGEREVKSAKLATEATNGNGEILMVHAPELQYDESVKVKKRDFRNEAGKAARAYRLSKGDIITLTENLFDGVVAVGDILAPKTAGKLGKVVDASTSNLQVKVIENCGNELDITLSAFAVQVL